MLDNWQRIEQIIKWAGFASVSAFAREIGLNRSENLYQIKRGNNGISKDLAESITGRFPDISKAWLLTGEGVMLKGDAAPSPYDVPFYKYDVVNLLECTEYPEPEHNIFFPVFEGCDFAAFTFAAAMEPVIPRGAILFFRREKPDTATLGEIYLIVSPKFTGIRYLRREPGSDSLRLVAPEKADYDDVIIPAQSVEKLFRVCGIVVYKK